MTTDLECDLSCSHWSVDICGREACEYGCGKVSDPIKFSAAQVK